MADTGGTALTRVESTARNVSALSGGTEAFEVAQRMAKALASSTVVPTEYRGNIANVMVAMEYANRLGASVLAVMQNLDLIHGRPSLRATFLIGTVNASGRFSPIRYRWQGEEGGESWGCRAVATDRESGEECIGPLITIGLAQREGWYEKKGSKWQTIPELMLMYRAGAWWTRVYCPELSLGLHTMDEVEDMGPAPEERAKVLRAALDAEDEKPEATDPEPQEHEESSGGNANDAPPPPADTSPRAKLLAYIEAGDYEDGPGTAEDEQRDQLRQAAVDLYPDGEDRAAMLAFSDHESLGKRQASKALGYVGLAREAEQGSLV